MRSENPATLQKYTIEKIIKSNFSTTYKQAFCKTKLLFEIDIAFTKTLKTLSEQINEGVDLYNTSYILGGNQLQSDKEYRRNFKKLKRLIKEKPLQEVSAISSVIAKEKLKRDYILLNFLFRTEETWQKLEEGLDRNVILDLKDKWELSAKFSHFTLIGLMNVIDILEQLHHLLDLTINEFELHKAKINVSEQKHYTNELVNLREKIKREKKHIANNLYARCQNAMFNDKPTHPSLLINLLNNLLMVGSVDKKFIEDMLTIQSEPEKIDFSYVYHYASKHASSWIKDDIQDKLVLSTYYNTSVTLVHKKIDNNQYLIPHSLIKYIPHKKPYRFFFARRQRYTFFKDKGLLFTKLIVQQNNKPQLSSLEDLLENPTWLSLANLQKELEIANQEVNKLANSRFNIFRRVSLRFYKEWQSILIGQQSKLCKAQIDFLVQLANQPRTLSELFEKPYMNSSVRQQISHAIAELSRSQAFSYLSNEDKEKFYPIQRDLIARCKNDHAIEAVNLVLARLANNVQLNEADFSSSQQYLFKLSHERLNKHFTNNEGNLNKIFDNVVHIFNNVISNNNVENHPLVFSQQVKLLKTFLHISKLNTLFVEKLPIHLDKFLDKYASYLHNQTQETVVHNKVFLEQLEETVNAVLMTVPAWRNKVQSFALMINARLLLEQGIEPMLGQETLKLAKKEKDKTTQFLKESRKERVANLAKLSLLPVKITHEPDAIELPKDAHAILESAKISNKSASNDCKRFKQEREGRLSQLNKMIMFGNNNKEVTSLPVSNTMPNINI